MTTRQGVAIRTSAVATIIAQNTLAGAMVEQERYDDVAEADMPRVIVFAHEELDGTSKAGTAPRFKVSLHLEIQCLVIRARMADAVTDLDTLTGEVIEALLCDPVWPKQMEFIESGALIRQFKPQNERVIGDGRVTFVCKYNETYPPRVTTPLSQVDLRASATQPAGAAIGVDIILPPAEG
jgi:hypothetical protein